MPDAPDAERAPGQPEAERPLPSERRLVSVLFVDLEGFTPLAESLDPEDVRNIQARYFEAARSVITRYGGTIEKFIGDAVMAIWGAPTAHEDDADRAVRAALELVAAVMKLRGAVPDQKLTSRAAVGTGVAAVTLGVDGQGMVAGDLVNTAARLQAAAPSNAVLVDDTTRRLVGEAVTFEAVGQLTLKGKSRPVGAWRALGVAGEPKGRAAGHAGPFVGRAAELAELADLFARTVAARRCRIVSVVGIAGIGKSRLSWEFERHLDALPEPLALHVGRAPSYGDGNTFAPLVEMVRRRAGISEGTGSEVARRQLGRTLEELVPDDEERNWIEPRLATLLDPGMRTGFERDELFAAWRRFFERVSDWAPAVLIFADMQWADPALLDFVDHLATWSRAHPILIVTLARPELLDMRPTWGAGRHSFTAIRLEPLPDVAMAELVRGLAPDLPADVVGRIVARAGGVPLYGVEVLRMLVDRGQARAADHGFELLGTFDPAHIPETLRALVSVRVDALPPVERSMLLSASVLGHRFHPDALAAISLLEATEARARIAELVGREFLTVDDEPRSPGRGQLSFVQEVVRDVAYSTVSMRDRRRLHLAAADHLETLDDEELVEAVAEHLLAAVRAAPKHPDAPVVARRAVKALRSAAARALALRVPAQALAQLQDALELVDDEASRAGLWQDAAVAARAVPRFDLAETFLRQLIDWQGESGQPREAARSRAQLASLLLATERHGSALTDLEAALGGVADLSSDPSSVELTGQLARARVLVGDDRQALIDADRTLEAARKIGLEAVAIDALTTRGTAQMRLGNESAGLADLHAAIADAQRSGFIGAELRARNNLAWLVAPDDPHATMKTAREGLELAIRMGVGDMGLQLAEVVCAAAIDTGDWDLALGVLDDVRDRPLAPAHRLEFAASEAIVRALQGDPSAGAPLDALEPFDAETDPQILAGVDQARAWIAFVDGRMDDARRLAAAAAAQSIGAEQHAALVLATHADLWLGDGAAAADRITRLGEMGRHGRAVEASETTLRAGAAGLAGDPSARGLYETAISSWRALRLPLHLALCLAERGRFDPSGAGAVSDRDADEVADVLGDLGATGMLHLLRPDAPIGSHASLS